MGTKSENDALGSIKKLIADSRESIEQEQANILTLTSRLKFIGILFLVTFGSILMLDREKVETQDLMSHTFAIAFCFSSFYTIFIFCVSSVRKAKIVMQIWLSLMVFSAFASLNTKSNAPSSKLQQVGQDTVISDQSSIACADALDKIRNISTSKNSAQMKEEVIKDFQAIYRDLPANDTTGGCARLKHSLYYIISGLKKDVGKNDPEADRVMSEFNDASNRLEVARKRTPASIGSSSTGNIIAVDQPVADGTNVVKIAASERQMQLESADQMQKAKDQRTCLDVYHSAEQFIQSYDLITLSQYAHQVHDRVPYGGFNEGCQELKMFLFEMSKMWGTGEAPAPAEFERLARQLARAKQLLQDPKLKQSDFNTF